MSNTPRSSSPQQNHLLAGLPRAEYERLLPHLELVPLPLGKVLYEVGGRLDHVYFPTTAVVALLYVMENGASAEIAVVGNDGILGIAVFMGGDTRPNLAVVQNEGHAYRLKGQLLKQEFSLGEALQHQLLRYALALTTHGADRRLQSALSCGPATLSLAAIESGPSVLKRAEHDPETDRYNLGGAEQGGDQGYREIAE
jgi:hypothetical protein